MIKHLISVLLLVYVSAMNLVHAQTKLSVNENDTIDLTLSRHDFNRLFVEGDKITLLRFPENYLGAENDKDGSVYINVKYDKPFTVFVTTEKGVHFSAVITLSDELGKTIGFVASHSTIANTKRPETTPIVASKSVKQELMALISSVEKEQQAPGFQAQRPNIHSVQIQPHVTSTLIYTLANQQTMGQKFTLKNTGKTPVPFDDKWFKDKDTKALLVKQRVLYPNDSITVVRIETGVKHG